jgi:GNAT superfamily N-acetyltransferase
MDSWGRDRLADIVRICDAALPSEGLHADDVAAALFDDPDDAVVLGTDDAQGVVAAVTREHGDETVGFLQLLTVDPAAHRTGRGRELLRAAEGWAADKGVKHFFAGGAAPFYLWCGVDVHWTAANCLLEAEGYRGGEAMLNLSFSSSHKAPEPEGVEVRRVLGDDDAEAGLAFCAKNWPNWVAEMERGIEHGACFLAWAEGDAVPVGFGCHSVNRLGWLGPMGTDPERRHGGLGNALLSAIAGDVRVAGFDVVQVSWIGPFGFYANAADASVSRVFRRLVKRLA